ncbi:MAG: tRNA 2-thiouridine(34) synthase MnmA [Candidatus Marinimicrobia bacterium]|nr:tRNA 2-thiouridine(34) synthase MnmA [Candidatus Neomarinimicrobiota bacterium]
MKRIIVAMSGGVDSSVAASILIEQGFDVEALFMKNWEEDSEYCSAEQDYNDALQVCNKLNIPLHSINFTKAYWNRVFKHFLDEHKNGRTPNPDILCNTEIKFKEFLQYAIELGADKIATGHYVQNYVKNNQVFLQKGSDKTKDQSYFLYGLNQKQISSAMFPIGNMKKKEVRDRAKKLGFVNYNKKDSVGICFIGERNIKEFLKEYIPENPGDIVNINGDVIGKHEGLMYYTIGQRKGLGIGGGHSTNEGAWYVIDKNLKNNELIVGQGINNNRLFHKNLIASNVHWISGKPPHKNELHAKIRYRAEDVLCKIIMQNKNNIHVQFNKPCFGIAPGQSVVFYDKDICLGGGIIESYSH